MDYKELIGRLGCRKGNEVCKSSPVFYGFACDRCRETIMRDAATAIETLLEEREVTAKSARWKYYKKIGIAVCTECSFERSLNENFGRAISCPNCGAKMDY